MDDIAFPSGVVGPRDFWLLIRFAAIWDGEAMDLFRFNKQYRSSLTALYSAYLQMGQLKSLVEV
jgi:hypothetical protein